MKLAVTHVDYKVNNYTQPTLRIFGRDDSGKRIIKYASGMSPYFYCKEQDIVGKSDPRIIRTENGPPTLYGDRTVKVICNIPSEVAGKDPNYLYLKDLFNWSGEADVLFGNRAKIDYNISGPIEVPDKTFITIKDIHQTKAKINLRTHFLDIESIGGTIRDVINGKSNIPCLTVYDNYLNTYNLFTTIPLNNNDIESIKQKIHDFWVDSLEKLKASLLTEKEEEKAKTIEKQIKYLEKNLPRILNFKLSVKTALTEADNFTNYIAFVISNRPDVRAGWNSVKFDDPSIVNRMKTLGVPYQQLSDVGEAFVTKNSRECVISGVVLMDLMERYVKMQQATPSHRSLDYISKKELGVGKLIAGGHALYTSDPTTYLAYNIVDVMLCVELDTLLHIVDFYVEIANLTNSNLNEVSRSAYIDNLILTYCHNLYALPTRATIDAERMSGAIVYDPVPGLHKNVVIADFKGMYPSIMKSLNISPETKSPTGDIIASNGIRFDSSRIGIIPFILKSLDTKRDEYKKLRDEAKVIGDTFLEHEYDLKQLAIKILSNAFYGVAGYKKFRLADRDTGDAVTSSGRMLSISTKEFVEKLGYKVKVIYGDSVIAGTNIWIKNKSGEIYEEKIENLFKNVDTIDGDKEYDLLEDLQTLTIDNYGKSVWKNIKYVVRHKTNKKIYNISATNYWNINVTEDHSLMGYYRNRTKRLNEIIAVKYKDIGKKIKSIVSLKYIPRTIVSTRKYPKEVYKFLGLFLGDGSFGAKYGKNFYRVWLSCGFDDEEVIEKLILPLKTMGYIRSFSKSKSVRGNISISGKICEILKEFRSEKGKIVSDWMLKETEENLQWFLSGIFEGDGSISQDKRRKQNGVVMIRFSNTILSLIHGVQMCLNFIGIPSSIKRNPICKNGYKRIDGKETIVYDILIKDNSIFKKKISYITNSKKDKLDSLVINEKKGKCHVSNFEYDITGNLKINNIKYNGFVYDIEVEETHTFFANGFLAHNTDSLFIELEEPDITYEQINLVSKDLVNKINDFLPKLVKQKCNSDTCYCKIEADIPYKTLAMLPKKSIGKNEEEQQAKKRYCAYKWLGENKYEFKVKGLEYVKGNTADITRYVQEKLLKYVLDSTDITVITSFLKSLHDDFFSNAFPIEQIGKPTSLRMPLSEYKTDNPAKRAAEFSNRYLSKEYEDGSSFVLYHLKDATTDVIALDYAEPLPPQYHIDMQETWDKLINSPTETILQTRNLNWNDIISGTSYIQGQETMFETSTQPIVIPTSKISEMDLFL